MPITSKTIRHAEQPSRRRRQKLAPRMQPLLTPMVDIAFQMLLFFLLTSCFLLPEGHLPGTLPRGAMSVVAADQAIVKPIKIVLRPIEEGVVYELEGAREAVSDPEKLYQTLLALQQAYGSDEVPVVIQPRWDVPWSYVVEADNQAHRAKFRTVGITLAG